ncbi:MAG: hypothetical protein JO258_11385 [Alphaproteobacteria bacterium]|nr:hypothetical protein [Alphaproteobacteria bacterium]
MRSNAMHEARHRQVLKAALLKVAAASRRLRRRRRKRARPLVAPLRPAAGVAPPAPVPDPVKIAVLAMERLGRASIRASFTGVEVMVTAPDDATAAIFRAALSETTRTRPTDRLVRVVVD